MLLAFTFLLTQAEFFYLLYFHGFTFNRDEGISHWCNVFPFPFPVAFMMLGELCS